MIMNHGRHCAEKRDIYSGLCLRLALILLLSLPLSRRRVSSWAREMDRGSAKTVHVTDSAQGGVVSDPEYLLLQEHFQNQLKGEIRFIAHERDQEFKSHFYVECDRAKCWSAENIRRTTSAQYLLEFCRPRSKQNFRFSPKVQSHLSHSCFHGETLLRPPQLIIQCCVNPTSHSHCTAIPRECCLSHSAAIKLSAVISKWPCPCWP